MPRLHTKGEFKSKGLSEWRRVRNIRKTLRNIRKTLSILDRPRDRGEADGEKGASGIELGPEVAWKPDCRRSCRVSGRGISSAWNGSTVWNQAPIAWKAGWQPSVKPQRECWQSQLSLVSWMRWMRSSGRSCGVTTWRRSQRTDSEPWRTRPLRRAFHLWRVRGDWSGMDHDVGRSSALQLGR